MNMCIKGQFNYVDIIIDPLVAGVSGTCEASQVQLKTKLILNMNKYHNTMTNFVELVSIYIYIYNLC